MKTSLAVTNINITFYLRDYQFSLNTKMFNREKHISITWDYCVLGILFRMRYSLQSSYTYNTGNRMIASLRMRKVKLRLNDILIITQGL